MSLGKIPKVDKNAKSSFKHLANCVTSHNNNKDNNNLSNLMWPKSERFWAVVYIAIPLFFLNSTELL